MKETINNNHITDKELWNSWYFNEPILDEIIASETSNSTDDGENNNSNLTPSMGRNNSLLNLIGTYTNENEEEDDDDERNYDSFSSLLDASGFLQYSYILIFQIKF